MSLCLGCKPDTMRRASGESAEPIAHKRLIETGGAFSKFGTKLVDRSLP
jgi:hypothetical protein